jgi:CubicO group peptidase (beta-lactamase class C family)
LVCSLFPRGAVALLIALSVVVGGVPAHAKEGAHDRDYWPTEGWRTAKPADRGLDPALLEEAGRRVATEWPLVSSLVVVQGGYVVHEQYAGDLPPDEPIMTWSVTKSVTSVAVGIAVREGLISDLDQTLGELIRTGSRATPTPAWPTSRFGIS